MHKLSATKCGIFTLTLKAINSGALIVLVVGALVIIGVGAIVSYN
jgi:hypothetical protein